MAVNPDGSLKNLRFDNYLYFECPLSTCTHEVRIAIKDKTEFAKDDKYTGGIWEMEGDLENLTLKPSIFQGKHAHYWIKNGKAEII